MTETIDTSMENINANDLQPPPLPFEINVTTAEIDLDTPQDVFDRLDKDSLMKHMKLLKSDDTINGKVFYKTYSKWDMMTPEQRAKALEFWLTNLIEHVRQSVKCNVEKRYEESTH